MKLNTYKLEFKLFFRSSSAWIGILILLSTGFAGLYFGKTFIDSQQTVIKKAAHLQKKNTNANIKHFGNHIGLFFFHNKFSIANEPSRWAGFANGQRDINPYLISVNMLGLEGQLYDTDISNPVNLLFGNMDLSFVFIFLFPLVIIALTYNLISEQKESGIWFLLRAQTNKMMGVIWQKFLIRVVCIYVVALILLASAVMYLQLPANSTLFSVILLIALYIAFWFAVSFFIISLGKSSSYNASALVGIWVLLCIVIPASLNLYLTNKFPVPEALQNVVNQREGYHEKWDLDKDKTMVPFFKHYPALQKYPFPKDKSFSWFWYYGMQQMGDDDALQSRLAIDKKLTDRQSFTNFVALFFPTIQTQLGVNELANSDLNAHLAFQQIVRQYHEKVRLHFYPSIFLNKNLLSTDIKTIDLKTVRPQIIPHNTFRFLSIGFILMLLSLLSILNFKKGNAHRLEDE